ncbi:MAG: DUF1189 family protein [Elusimicrobia bacterium]|nr:DUF1189 family protein [Elusimicrobiota bacterium]
MSRAELAVFLADPLRCVARRSFYAEARRRSLGRCLLFVAYLSVLSGGAFTIWFGRELIPSVRRSLRWAAESMPTLVLAEGRVLAYAKDGAAMNTPTRIELLGLAELAVVFDTARETAPSAEELRSRKGRLYLTSGAVHFLQSPEAVAFGGPEVESLPLGWLRFDRPLAFDERTYRATDRLLGAVWLPISLAVGVVSSFLIGLLATAAYAALGLLLNVLFGTGLAPSEICKVAAYARSGTVLFEVVVVTLPALLPIPRLPPDIPEAYLLLLVLAGHAINLGLTTTYLCLGLTATADSEPRGA